MDDDTAQLLHDTLADEIDRIAVTRHDSGVWVVRGRIRARVDHYLDALTFLEELGAEIAGGPVFVDGPVVDPEIPTHVAWPILDAPPRVEDVVHVQRPYPRMATIVVRNAPDNLSSKGNRLPRLERELDGWDLTVKTAGSCANPRELSSHPDVAAFLEPFLAEYDIDPDAMHTYKVDTRVGRVVVQVDAEDVPPLELMRLGRRVRDKTDLEAEITHRISGHRARDVVYQALAALEGIEGHKVQWDNRIDGVSCTIDAPMSREEELQAFVDRQAKQLGVPVVFEFDRAGEVMVDRLAAAFPEDGILTDLRHAEDDLYFAEALLPLRDREELLAWADQMEERWGVQIVFEDPYLRAPDIRYRDEFGTDRDTIARRYNRPKQFPDEVMAQAEQLVADFDLEAEIASGRRVDRRDEVVVSIDPKRTKDLDDALSIEQVDEGLYRVGIHIADVSPFVPQGTPIDDEALLRSFTTYLAEGEIPVLPPILSDQVCSLHGGQDSPAMSLHFLIDEELEVREIEVGRSAIHNHCRLNYAQAQGILDGKEHEHAWRLRTFDRLAQELRARRKAAGSLDLNLEPDPQKRSHQLIEEFMLLANECVARFLVEQHPESLCLYRVHPYVGETDWTSLQQVAQFLGMETSITDQDSMQAALEEAADLARQPSGDLGPLYQVFRYHVGRTLEKATYHFEQLGHGALAKTHYAHFTSPIRRYPDLIVHRLIEDALYAEERDGESSYSTAELIPIQDHVNAMEIRVDAASFESHRLAELQGFDRGTRVEDGTLVGLMNGWASIRLDRTDLSVGVRYRDDKTLGIDMPVRVNDRNTGMAFALGQRVTVRTTGVDWKRASVQAEIIGIGGSEHDW